MAIEKVKAYLRNYGMEERVLELDMSSATVELAAQALHCQPERIAKTLSKAKFAAKAKMLSPQEAEAMVGHAVGGVCPFAVNPGVAVYLDVSLKRFETVFPACGSSNSAIELTIPELEECSGHAGWVDVCKGYQAP